MGIEIQVDTLEDMCSLMCDNTIPRRNNINMEEEICGHCRHHRKENEEWVCTNPDSDCYGCWTEYRDGCSDFEDRVNSRFSVTIVKKSKKS